MHQFLLQISGPDKPGITAAVMQILATKSIEVCDLGQSVVRGQLSLSVIIQSSKTPDFNDLNQFCVKRWLRFSQQKLDPTIKKTVAPQWILTLVGALGTAGSLARITKILSIKQVNIWGIRTLHRQKLVGLELKIVIPPSLDVTDLKQDLLRTSRELGIDMALQKDDFDRLNRRLLCLDVDSTVVDLEVIDELARLCGSRVFDETKALTERAMRGELAFDQALRKRVALLKGLSFQRAKNLRQRIPYNPGIKRLVRQCKRRGIFVGVVSGGFDFFVEKVQAELDLDFAFANKLEVQSGVLTGRVLGPIVNAKRKAQVLGKVSREFGVPLGQCIAVGDGANDRKMLEAAGLGVAYRAKPKLLEVADSNWDRSDFDSLLFLMGLEPRFLGA